MNLNERQMRTKAISAPTGFGKSDLVVGFALWTGEPTCIVTDSRALQDQYMTLYQGIGMVDIRGRKNYPCELRADEEYTCEQGYQAGCPYKGTLACPSSAAEMRASTSRLVVTNYDKWTAAKKYGRGMQHFRQVIFDEGHEAPNALGRAMQFRVNHRERDKWIMLDPPANPDQMEAWKPWGFDARDLIENELARSLEALRGRVNPLPGLVRHALHMRLLYKRLGVLATCRPDNWIVEEDEKGFQFDPIFPGRYAESHLLLRVPSVVVVSATLRPKTMYMIGQGKDTFDFREFDSDFDPKRNPIYWVPTMRVDKRATSLAQLWVRLDQIASKRRDRKGICHTVSYARRDELVSASRFANQMIINERGEAPTEMIELFKSSGDGTILVSPAVGQGHDFPGSTCEWQFLCKIPFPPPSKILKARTEEDPEYPYYLAMLKMVQTFGRGMRSKSDLCENFIADDHVEWFLPKYGHLAPRSFHSFFRKATVLPQPPARLERR